MALWGTVGGLCYAYAVEALVADPGSLPGGLVAAWFDNWWWLPGLALPLCVLLVSMPDGHLASRRWWPVPAAVAVGTVLGSVAVSTSPTFDLGTATPIENPLARAGGSTIVIARDRRCDPRHRWPGGLARGVHRPLPPLRRRRATAVALGRSLARPRRAAGHCRRAVVGCCSGRRAIDWAGVSPPAGRDRCRCPQVPALRDRPRHQPRSRLRRDDDRRRRRLCRHRRTDRRDTLIPRRPFPLARRDRCRGRLLPARCANACSGSSTG